MKKYVCDHCGREINSPIFSLIWQPDLVNTTFKVGDFCDDCQKKIDKFFDDLIKNQTLVDEKRGNK